MSRPKRDREAKRRAAEDVLDDYLKLRDASPWTSGPYTESEVEELLEAFGSTQENIDRILSLRMARSTRGGSA